LFIFVLHTVPGFTTIISPSLGGSIPFQRVGNPLDINCTVSTVSGVELNSVMISWMGPGGGNITTNSRVIIIPTISIGNNMFTSTLRFVYLMDGEDGAYTCNVAILETTGSQSVVLASLTSKSMGISRSKHHASSTNSLEIVNIYFLIIP